jgi:hypothetical protein
LIEFPFRPSAAAVPIDYAAHICQADASAFKFLNPV